MFVRAQAIIPFDSGLPEDVISNTFTFLCIDDLEDLEEASLVIAAELITFYNLIYVGGIAAYINQAAAYVKCYDIEAPTPSVPVVQPMVFSPGSIAPPLPTECAAVLSFQGNPESGAIQARRRGRVFIGGLPASTIAISGAANFPLFTASFINALRNGALSLLDLPTGITWGVWSTVNSSYTAVNQGWIDNAPDTQRRRGVLPTVRTTY